MVSIFSPTRDHKSSRTGPQIFADHVKILQSRNQIFGLPAGNAHHVVSRSGYNVATGEYGFHHLAQIRVKRTVGTSGNYLGHSLQVGPFGPVDGDVSTNVHVFGRNSGCLRSGGSRRSLRFGCGRRCRYGYLSFAGQGFFQHHGVLLFDRAPGLRQVTAIVNNDIGFGSFFRLRSLRSNTLLGLIKRHFSALNQSFQLHFGRSRYHPF